MSLFTTAKALGKNSWLSLVPFILGLEAALCASEYPIGFFVNIVPGLVFSILAVVVKENSARRLGIAALIINIMALLYFVVLQILVALWMSRNADLLNSYYGY